MLGEWWRAVLDKSHDDQNSGSTVTLTQNVRLTLDAGGTIEVGGILHRAGSIVGPFDLHAAMRSGGTLDRDIAFDSVVDNRLAEETVALATSGS
jgi:hypothetical protein